MIKTRSQNDQHAVMPALSETGLRLMEQAPKPARGLIPEALGRLDAQALAQLNAGLQAVIGVIDADESFGLQPLPFTM